ncbi:hypothetical protein MKW94_020117 [Papaver nudicaule]|uniref:Uncharacterized protein n=1 Tax=Papaver nudicaule TaxID=74823 RepID=A0AA41W295_PAPNU|nr:hypothetical protein [Papaver nudicaule]
MSWHSDPQLFMFHLGTNYNVEFRINRIVKKYNVPLVTQDFRGLEELNFSRHLSLGNNFNKESDYDALKAILVKNSYQVNKKKMMEVNCQGLNSELVAENSLLKQNSAKEVTNLQEQNHEKNAKQALEKQVLELTTKLEECRGAGSGSADVQPWMTSDTVPSHWVPFEDLDTLNLNLSKNTPVKTIMEEPGKPKLVKDVTTNIQVSRFYRGAFIVAVNVAELSPDNKKARFDPEFWGLYTNEGVTYAARKPLDSEM